MPDPGTDSNVSKAIGAFHPKVLATDMGNLSANFVDQAHGAQAMVFVDDRLANPTEWATILNLGTDGIQTDQPEALIRYLQSLTN